MSKWEEYKAKVGTTRPWDILVADNRNFDETVSAKRYEICEECPRFLKATKQCKECGCFMKLKVTLKEATCPIKKW
jgi:hypothetical protein